MAENSRRTSRQRVIATMLRLAWQADRAAAVLAFVLAGLGAITQSLYGLWLKFIVDGIHTGSPLPLGVGAVGGVVSIAASVAVAYGGQRAQSRLRDHTRYLMNAQILNLVSATPTLELHENPHHLSELYAFQREGHQLSQVLPRMVELCAVTVQIVTTAVLMVLVDPLLLALPLFAVPSLLVSFRTSRIFRDSGRRAAGPARLAEHLVELTATPGGAKEVRLFRLQAEMLRRFQRAHHQIRRLHGRAQLQAAGWSLSGRLVFIAGYIASIAFVVRLVTIGEATIGEAALIAVLAGQVLGLVSGSSEVLQLTIQSLVAADRFVRLQDLFGPAAQRGHRPVPPRLAHGISLRNVSYQYDGAAQPALEKIDVDLPAGSTIAIVGENGAGKSTLVKLLAGLYNPTDGTITIDGKDLASIDLTRWQHRVSAAFQDHARFELLVRETVALGDIENADSDLLVLDALERAAATDVLSALPRGLDTQLGSGWPAGVDLSGGQWQKLAIARAMMRPAPALLLLDEPSAALDPETEHRLFEAWTKAASDLRVQAGTITVLVSHRFSTVRMADTIVVLQHGTIAEHGSHEDLVHKNGLYAELFNLQASAYH
ncbi:ATP-binding cassette subfamily B protein [Kribbella sp. VKM Ac-2571]|uniref:ABC transporter ATP-binding protein n=1 Tax=Kribbella sp. VKM Ac-2571 TaxID=2512222 RepID=UPI001060C560|nr:ABC transporter ATP-binding protein [Kribbella sp. VKM Ac-2571]TDO64029.1 ATP-binding cassette subfamily B protein [Kribbella sp. VKM Ac-2571]